MKTASPLKYFAYGSNMHPRRLQERVPSSKAIGLAQLSGHVLRFHKRGQDGSGKCNVFFTGRTTDTVIGVIYEMAASEKPRLDRAEGLGKGYREATRRLVSGDIEHTLFFYQAEDGFIDNTLRPFTWYKALVLGGCLAHRLPQSYVSLIEKVEAVQDPDSERTRLHGHLLQSFF